MRSGSALLTDTIGERSPRTEIPRRRATSVPAAPISCAIASSSISRAPAAFRASTARIPCECPTTATGGVAIKSRPCRARVRIAAIWVSRTPGSDAAAEVRCLVDGTGSSAASARTQRSGSKPIGRTTTSSRGHRLEQQVHLADQRRQLGFDAGRRHQLFQRLQPRAALPTERDRVGLAGSQPIDESMSVRGGFRRGRRTLDGAHRSSRVYLPQCVCPSLACQSHAAP